MSDQVPESYFPPREPSPEEARSNVLFGLGLFAIRLSSDAAWWTGHRVYVLLPR